METDTKLHSCFFMDVENGHVLILEWYYIY